MLEQLRQRLQAMQKPVALDGAPGCLPLGVKPIDATLGGGLARGALHEIAAPSEAHLAAATGFAAGLAALRSDARAPSPRLRGEGRGEGVFPNTQNRGNAPSPDRLRHSASKTRVNALMAQTVDLSPHAGRGERHRLAWIAEDTALVESGALCGLGLDAFGLPPERLLTVAAARTQDLLWAMEEALHCRAVGTVIGEWRHGAIDPVAVRRLSLAAADGGALALLLRTAPMNDLSTAATRWIVGAAPTVIPYGFRSRGLTPASRNDEEIIPRFAAHLVRNRRGPTGSWILQWSEADEHFLLAPHAQPVAAPALDRPHRQVA